MVEITKETIIGDVLKMDIETAEIFLEYGMHCVGCPSARGESIGDACLVHGIDVNELIQALNLRLQSI